MKGRGRRGGSSRKDMQVAGEVRRTVDMVLAETTDGRLAGAFVAEVSPAPDASRLLVVVEVPPSTDLDAAYGLLGEMHGLFRAEVASAVDRRKAPDLFFQVRTSTPPE